MSIRNMKMAVQGRTQWQKEEKGLQEGTLLCVTEQVKEKLQTTMDAKVTRSSRNRQ